MEDNSRDGFTLSPFAREFIPCYAVNFEEPKISKPRKTKEQRACPRKRRRRKNLDDTHDSNQWLELQEQWRNSKNYLMDESTEDEYAIEMEERQRWAKWAVLASEIERKRRIAILQEIDQEEFRERHVRQQLALAMMEQEKNERVAYQYLNSLTSTNWFNATISNYNDDYELVCFYFRLGCRVKCRRSTLNEHLKTCVFALECGGQDTEVNTSDYEVVCPNSVLGCQFTGNRTLIQAHLRDECLFGASGRSSQLELQERELLKKHVIMECEEERNRRIRHGGPGHPSPPSAISNIGSQTNNTATSPPQIPSVTAHTTPVHTTSDPKSSSQKPLLHQLLEAQMQAVCGRIHEEVKNHSLRSRDLDQRREAEDLVVRKLSALVSSLWAYSSLQVFGSHVTGLKMTNSDIDLVVCFSDQCQSQGLLRIRGVLPLLQALAVYLGQAASDFLVIQKVLIHTRVPLIRAEAVVTLPAMDNSFPNHTTIPSSSFSPASSPSNRTSSSCDIAGRDKRIVICVDISIDSPAHSGLATTELVRTLNLAFPALGPTATVLRAYLHAKGLSDPYTGGLSFYGLLLLVALLLLKQYHERKNTSAPEAVAALSTIACSKHKFPYHRTFSGSSLRSKSNDSSDTQVSQYGGKSSVDQELKSLSAITAPQPTPQVYVHTEKSLHSREPRIEYENKLSLLLPPPSPSPASSSFSSITSSPIQRTLSPLQTIPEISSGSSSYRRAEGPITPSRSMEHTWYSVRQQRMFGRKVALKLLGIAIPPDTDPLEIPLFPMESMESPSLGELIVKFLNFYGDDCVLWKHGFSLREGGFRFDVEGGDGRPAHPQAEHPLVIEDPVNVMNNVACTCFNASSVQNAFVEALGRFKKIVVRHNEGNKVFPGAHDTASSPGDVPVIQQPRDVLLLRHNSTESHMTLEDELNQRSQQRMKQESNNSSAKSSIIFEIFGLTLEDTHKSQPLESRVMATDQNEIEEHPSSGREMYHWEGGADADDLADRLQAVCLHSGERRPRTLSHHSDSESLVDQIFPYLKEIPDMIPETAVVESKAFSPLRTVPRPRKDGLPLIPIQAARFVDGSGCSSTDSIYASPQKFRRLHESQSLSSPIQNDNDDSLSEGLFPAATLAESSREVNDGNMNVKKLFLQRKESQQQPLRSDRIRRNSF